MVACAPGPGGTLRYIRQSLLFDGTTGSLTRPTPALGEHTAEVLGELGSKPGA